MYFTYLKWKTSDYRFDVPTFKEYTFAEEVEEDREEHHGYTE